jgi:hypothetical protein
LAEVPKPQLHPELAELLPPETLLYIQKSTAPSVWGMSLVQEGSTTIRKGRDKAGKLVIIKQRALTAGGSKRGKSWSDFAVMFAFFATREFSTTTISWTLLEQNGMPRMKDSYLRFIWNMEISAT